MNHVQIIRLGPGQSAVAKRLLGRLFAANGRVCDADVLEELSTHAASAYEALRADGRDAGEAERCVDDRPAHLQHAAYRACSGRIWAT
jgi:hypothetical protein